MADLTLLFALGPAIPITLFLLLFFRSRVYGRIAWTLALICWINAFLLLLEIPVSYYQPFTGSGMGVDEGVLIGQFGLSVLQSGAYILEELLLWGFVAFFAVIIGSIYLFITVMRKKGGSLIDRMNQVTFKGNIENPLTAKFDVFGMQTYLIIGLVTMPSMISLLIAMDVLVAQGTLTLFSLSAVYYVLLFYRYSMMAYTRIANKADLRYGKEELGKKYQKRMLSWFTYLNLIISVVSLAYTFITLGGNPAINLAGAFAASLVAELKELLVAVLVLPFVEGFATIFFERFWHFWTRLRTRIRRMNLKAAFYSLARGVLVGGACFVLFYSILSFITAATTFFAVFGMSQQPVFNVQVGAVDIYGWLQHAAPTYDLLLFTVLWSMVALFLFQLIKVLIGGSLTHRKGVAPEYSIIIAAITIGVLIWVIMPATNFFLGGSVVSLTTDSGVGGYSFLYMPQPLSPQFYTIYYFIPAPTELLYIAFLDIPIWVFGSLLLTYFFIYRRQLMPAKKGEGVFMSSDFFNLFTSFCVVIVAAVAAIFFIGPTSPLGGIVDGLLRKLWFPNASTDQIFMLIGPAFVFFHNMIRFLLTVFAPLLFWVSIIGIWKAWRGQQVKYIYWYILALAVLVLEGITFYDRFTFIAIIGIPIVLAALYRGFYRVVKRDKPKTMFRTTMLKISFYSLILCEIYSTALALADRYMFLAPLTGSGSTYLAGGNLGLLVFLLEIVPHGLVEIPAAMLAGMIGLYVARRMTGKLDDNEKNLDKFMNEGVTVFWSGKVWYAILIVTIFFAIAAVIEVTVAWNIMGPLANSFGFA